MYGMADIQEVVEHWVTEGLCANIDDAWAQWNQIGYMEQRTWLREWYR
jgi:hypothetical protein